MNAREWFCDGTLCEGATPAEAAEAFALWLSVEDPGRLRTDEEPGVRRVDVEVREAGSGDRVRVVVRLRVVVVSSEVTS